MSDEPKPDPRSWGDGYREGYAAAVRDASEHLHALADWCQRHGFGARARHTDSAARRVSQMPSHTGEEK